MPIKKKKKNIVVLGGGTGTYTVLTGLKEYADDGISLSAIVSMADSGGSTGRLRDEFGYLPVGDVRMALAALAEGENGDNLLRELFLYRFDKGTGLKGHNVGNLLLVALTDILGSETKAIQFAGEVLRIRGKVIPVTTRNVTLSAKYADGSIVKGETNIDEPPRIHDGTQRIRRLWLDPEAPATPEALSAIRAADMVVLGPGDLYTSILPNVIAGGVAKALSKAHAKLVLIVNLMSKYGQTHGFNASDFITETAKYIGRAPDVILLNNKPLPPSIIKKYRTEQEFPIVDDLAPSAGMRVIRRDFLRPGEVKKASGDVRKISLVRHDPKKLARALLSL